MTELQVRKGFTAGPIRKFRIIEGISLRLLNRPPDRPLNGLGSVGGAAPVSGAWEGRPARIPGISTAALQGRE
ncbi:MAG: hypothetical protein ACLQL2_06580 [Methylovirgula sp.]